MTESLAGRLCDDCGANWVRARLSMHCLVRNLDGATEASTDMYCQSQTGEHAGRHFWMCVKPSQECLRGDSAADATGLFELTSLGEWSRTRIPVFAAMVPIVWPPRMEPDIFVIDMTRRAIFEELPEALDSVRLKSDFRWPAGDQDCVREFLERVVPDAAARVESAR